MEQSDASMNQRYFVIVASLDYFFVICGTSRTRDVLDTTLKEKKNYERDVYEL